MSNTIFQKAHELDRLAAWQRINAAHADALWIWEARLLAAEELERKASELRASVAGAAWFADHDLFSAGKRRRLAVDPVLVHVAERHRNSPAASELGNGHLC